MYKYENYKRVLKFKKQEKTKLNKNVFIAIIFNRVGYRYLKSFYYFDVEISNFLALYSTSLCHNYFH